MARREVSRRGGRPSRKRQESAQGTSVETRAAVSDVQGLSAFDKFVRALDLLQQGKISDLEDPYKQLSAWYSGVQVINMSLGRAPFQLWKGPRDPSQVTSGPLFDLFQKPNRAQTWRQFLSQMIVHLHGKRGAAYIHKFGVGEGGFSKRMPKELRLLDPERVQAVVSKEDTYELKGWKISRGKNGESGGEMEPDEIVPIFLAADPETPWASVSPQLPGSLDLDTERMAGLYTASTLASGGSPGLLFTFLGDADWDPTDATKIEEKLRAKYGSPDGFRMAAVAGDWKVQNLGMRPRDMEFVQWRAWIINVIARLLGITPLILAHYEGATGLSDAGLRVQERINYRQKFIPLGSLIAEALQRGVIDAVDPTVEAIFDFSQIEALQDDFGAKVVAAQALAQMGVPLAQINDVFDLGLDISKIPWAGEWFVPLGMSPARFLLDSGFDVGGESDTPEPEDQAQETEVAALIAEIRDLRQTVETVLLDEDARPATRAPGAAAGADESESGGSLSSADESAVASTPETEKRAVRRLPKKKRRTEAARYVREAQKVENAMKGKIGRAMMKHRARTLRVFAEVAGSSLRAVVRAHPRAVDLTEDQIAAMTPEEVVARSPLNLDLNDIDQILAAIEDGQILDALGPVITAAFTAGAKTLEPSLKDLGVGVANLAEYKKRLPNVTDAYKRSKRGGPAELLEEITRAKVRSVIVESIDEGRTVSEAADLIRDVFNQEMSEGRARTIARTETAMAMSYARNDAMGSLGVDEIEWSSVIDERTRRDKKGIGAPDHAKMNGERIAVGPDARFSNGLRWPTDPSGSPGEIINCRCVAIPVARADRDEEPEAEAASLSSVERVVKKVGGRWYVLSLSGRRLSKGFGSEAAATARLEAIESFKQATAEG